MKKLMVKRMKISGLIMILLSLQFALFAQTKGDYITPLDKQSVNLNDSSFAHTFMFLIVSDMH
jgi:hypothetical protein